MFSLLMNDFFTYEATSQVVNKAIISNYHIPSEKFSYQNTVHSQRQKKSENIVQAMLMHFFTIYVK